MTKDELLSILRRLASGQERGDEEGWHIQADEALIEYINDAEIAEAYNGISKWYA